MAKKKPLANRPEQSGPLTEVEFAVANPNPDQAEVARRASEDEFQDAIDDLIEAKREQAEAGDGTALLDALFDFCINSDRDMPEWLRLGVGDAVRKYTKLHARTLDEAFRLPERKGFSAKSKRARLGCRIYAEVCTLHAAGASITQELYHAVGARHGVGRNFVEECYTKELRRRGGRRIVEAIEPAKLPKSLWATFEAITGNRPEKRL